MDPACGTKAYGCSPQTSASSTETPDRPVVGGAYREARVNMNVNSRVMLWCPPRWLIA